ncbi:hypothetical protein EV2_005709 [Malus domestica]
MNTKIPKAPLNKLLIHCISASVACERVFFSDVRDDNHLGCLVEKFHIVRLTLNVDQDVKSKSIPVCNYYCDTKYLLPYSTFVNLRAGYCSLSTYCHDAGFFFLSFARFI